MGLFDFFKHKKPSLPEVTGSTEQAVLVFLDGVSLPDEVYESCDTSTIEDLLLPVLERTGVGEFDGTEAGLMETCLFLYGKDAEKLFATIEPILKDYPLSQGARVVIRHGAPGAPHRELRLPLLEEDT
jgi:hypothetical protein